MKNKKKAFTLTELLVVVIVIGVLSAAVLPKFSKVIETRKTTEAEELMASIRTEQEKRCALDKPYLTDLSNMSEIVKKTDTKNYQLTLQDKGVIASSKGNYSYNLQMPSYADGRICCDGDDCAKLNKNYPSCTGFTYEPSPDSCAGTVTPVEPEKKECSGSSTQACGCQSKGTQSRTCNTTTGEWSDWGACSISDSCECTGTKPGASQDCNKCGTQTRTVTCDNTTGEWKTGSWGTCSKTEAECLSILDPIEIDPCFSITESNWSTCCSGKYTDTNCYRRCSKQSSSGGNEGDAEQAQNPPSCNLTAADGYYWFKTISSCSEWSGDIAGYCSSTSARACCDGFQYECRKSSGSGSGNGGPATLTPIGGGNEDKLVVAVQTYYCAAYSSCSESCPGYYDMLQADKVILP